MEPVAVGVDVGGTKVLAVALGAAPSGGAPGPILAEAEVPTPQGGAAVVQAIVATVRDVLAPHGPAVRATVGLGLPGLVDRSGVLRYGPNLPGVLDLDVAALVGEHLGEVLAVPFVAVDNDGNCAALAEARGGAATGASSALFIGLGTGIACGIVIDGRIWRGAHGFAGESGHIRVDPSGPRCACGAVGCWEAVASGSALDRIARELGADGGGALTAAERRGDPDPEGLRAAALDRFGEAVASGLVGLCNVLDPEVVVLGGSVMDAADVLLPRITAAATAARFGGERGADPPVRVAVLGRRAGAVGAALIGVDDPPGAAG